MQPRPGVAAPDLQIAPLYPAELLLPPAGWTSRLAHHGVVPLNQPVVHLGLLATNDIAVYGPYVSRLHAVIRWTPSGYEIEDLNSASGTYVDGQRVTGRMALTPGATLRIGMLDVRFQPVASMAAESAQPPAQSLYPASAYRALAEYAGVAPRASYDVAQPSRSQAWRERTASFQVWRERTAKKRYWRVFLIGLLAYIAADLLVNLDLNRHAIPLVILLASALVPVTFVVFCWEEGAFADMPPTVVGLTFVSGAVMGILVAGFLEDLFLANVPGGGLLMISIIEEGAKAAAVVWFLRDQRLRSELDGLVLGAAAGMGFATLETAGYGFNAFLGGYSSVLVSQGSLTQAISSGIASMTVILILRMILAVFGHGVWTAIVCAAIWRERGPAVLRITGGVVLAFFISVVLHAMWDLVALSPPLFWLLPIVAFSGLWILRFFIHEAVDRAKLGSLAPPPAPLFDALIAYLMHPLRRPTVQPHHGPAPVAAPMAMAPMAISAQTCPNGHLVSDAGEASCPQCDSPMPSAPSNVR